MLGLQRFYLHGVVVGSGSTEFQEGVVAPGVACWVVMVQGKPEHLVQVRFQQFIWNFFVHKPVWSFANSFRCLVCVLQLWGPQSSLNGSLTSSLDSCCAPASPANGAGTPFIAVASGAQ